MLPPFKESRGSVPSQRGVKRLENMLRAANLHGRTVGEGKLALREEGRVDEGGVEKKERKTRKEDNQKRQGRGLTLPAVAFANRRRQTFAPLLPPPTPPRIASSPDVPATRIVARL